jgi:hypothetical protein
MSACGGSSADRAAPASPEPVVTPSAGSVALPASGGVPELLRFRAPLVDGSSFDAAALAGTPAVFWFWAPT